MKKIKKKPYTEQVTPHASRRRKMLVRALIIAAVALITIFLWFMALVSPKNFKHKSGNEPKSVSGLNQTRLQAK